MSLTRDELLVVLIEECAEVIQAATKCLRFGFNRREPDYGRNDVVLAEEIGDLLGMTDALAFYLYRDVIERQRASKIVRAERAKRVRVSHET